MLRFGFLIGISCLFYGNSAMPYRSWGKVADTAAQETMVSEEEFYGKMLSGMKDIEPSKDMGITNEDIIDPSMLLWKAMKESRKQKYTQAEEDKDALYHPYEEQLIDVGLPEAYLQPQGFESGKSYEQAEPDMDDMFHSFSGPVRSPEEDQDQIYHPDEPVQPEKTPDQVKEEQTQRRVYTSAEEDKDELYHGDITGQQADLPHQQDPKIQVFPYEQEARIYTEPEEDMDHLYHI